MSTPQRFIRGFAAALASVGLTACIVATTGPSAGQSGGTPGQPPINRDHRSPGTAGVQGEACGDADRCQAGLECIRYYGIAGANGPQFATCELQCGDQGGCPPHQECTTIADGPGQVCRSATTTDSSDSGQPAPSDSPPAKPPGAQGQACGDHDSCESGLECVKYYGIAGPRGPQFSSCEVLCAGGESCPDGQACTTIADGPGQVCRAAPPSAPAPSTGAQGQKCGPDDSCQPGLMCLKYYGFAGPRGPQFSSCEIPCRPDRKPTGCPAGQACNVVSDGPGAVCQAK